MIQLNSNKGLAMQELLREANILLDEIDATIDRMFQAAIDAKKAKEGWEL